MLHLRPFRAFVPVLLIALGLSPSVPLFAEPPLSDSKVEAAYIYSFAKFTEWPAQSFGSPSSPIRFCILNDHSFGIELDRIAEGKSIAGHPIEVLQVDNSAQARACHLLFVSLAHERMARRLIEALRGTSVLTIGESDSFLADGGMINFVLEDDRVQFHISQRAVKEAGLYMSARLLAVAKRVME